MYSEVNNFAIVSRIEISNEPGFESELRIPNLDIFCSKCNYFIIIASIKTFADI